MWARVVSFLFHPLLIPTYFFSFLSLTVPTALAPVAPHVQSQVLGFVFLVTCVIPVLNLGMVRSLGGFRTFEMPTRKERMVPFVLISVIYVAVTFMFGAYGKMTLNDSFLKFIIVIDMLVVAATVATFFFKVSVHTLAVWGLVGILVPLNKITEIESVFYGTVAVIALAGFIMSARLITGAHTSREVMWGAVMGLITGFGGMLILFRNLA